MRVIAHRALVIFYREHANAKAALEEWYKKTGRVNWDCFADIKKTFNSVDHVGDQRFVFNIKGNEYRLIVAVNFPTKIVYVLHILTHSQYDKIRLK
jgi:mRNA interferase HigB